MKGLRGPVVSTLVLNPSAESGRAGSILVPSWSLYVFSRVVKMSCTVRSKIIRALEIVRVKKLIFNAVL